MRVIYFVKCTNNMMNKIILDTITGFLICLFVISTALPSRADICETSPPLGADPVYTYQGTYENAAWGYAVDIPKGYKGGLYQDPGAPQQGIMVILSWKPRSTIYFVGEANSLEEESSGKPLDAIGHSIFGLNLIREYANDIKSYEMHKAKLGTLQGYKYIVRYTCPGSGDVRIKETIVAVDPQNSPVYTVNLETTQDRYKKDRLIFNQIVSKWRQIPRK